ncbi:hypothetical protein LZG07_16490 [Microbacterium profundi]|uniref:hypothetical protein n=1 Tax=Microbacterium profundi TaxID=450380 RepID=UPI001F45431C|nr:hypothetical protein [Microbacterium profundi]MCE7483497.1 hypothetical protein [Microbacterium profundi]
MMRQLYRFETRAQDGTRGVTICMATSAHQAHGMLLADGQDGRLIETISLGAQYASAALGGDSASPDELPPAEELTAPEALTTPDEFPPRALPEAAESEIVAAARDLAMLTVFSVGAGVVSTAAAVSSSTGDAVVRLAWHLLGVDVTLGEDEFVIAELDESAVVDLYLDGVSVDEIAITAGVGSVEVARVLLDSSSRVIAVTPAVLRAARGALESAIAKSATARA